MDIYGAGTNIKKLLAYVESIADNKPKMYAKSKDRLKEIAVTCNQVVEIISEILEDEMLQDDSIEFGQRSDIDDVLDNMQYQIDKIKQFKGVPEHTKSDSSISSATRKKVIKNYTVCLSKLSSIETSYPFADRCAKLIWTWFDVRFLKTVQGTSFRYNMKHFPEWISAIVILYSKAIQANEVAIFEDKFQKWIQNIITTEAKDKYAVPYEVYQFCKNPDPLDVTLDAVILWDILLDNGLRDICTADKNDLYLDEYSVYNLCNILNSNVLDDYCDYSTHPGIFIKLKWEGVSNE